MVRFETKIDSAGKIYIAKALRQSGLTDTIVIHPNSTAAVMHQAGTRIEDVLESIRIIVMDLQHQLSKAKRTAQTRHANRKEGEEEVTTWLK